MENSDNVTITALLREIEKIKMEHDILKMNIVKATSVFDEYVIKNTIDINNMIANLNILENKYVSLIEEITNRDGRG